VSKERTTQDILDDLRNQLLGLEQRTMTSKQVESAVWTLWGFVRDNKDSLDSERCCRMIQEIVNGAVESVTKRAEALSVELDKTGQNLRDSRKEVKRLTKELEKSCEEMTKLGFAVSKAQDDIESLQAMLAGKTEVCPENSHPEAA
jgi:chromosome segregation ATPase